MYSFESSIVTGEQLGRRIGFPTINLSIPKDFALEYGIYACRIDINGLQYVGALHFGPAFSLRKRHRVTLEVHILDVKNFFSSVGSVHVEVLEKIRPVQEFSDMLRLGQQIKQDIEYIRCRYSGICL